MLILFDGKAIVCHDVPEFEIEENAGMKEAIS